MMEPNRESGEKASQGIAWPACQNSESRILCTSHKRIRKDKAPLLPQLGQP